MFKTVMTLLLLLLLSACSSKESTEQKESNTTQTKQNTIKATTPAVTKSDSVTSQKELTPASSLFTLKTITGKTLHIDESAGGLTFQEYKDKAVFLIFFGHQCPPCLAEIPVLKALTNKGHKDLEIVALEVQGDSEEQLKDFQKRTGINYNLVTGKDYYDFINYIAQKANWTGSIPFLIGFNKKSEVKVVHIGGLQAQDFDNIYATLSQDK